MQDSETRLRVGIDCGSKTVKIIALDEHDVVVHKSYMYHQTNIRSTLERTLNEMRERIGDVQMRLSITGSAGMQIADDLRIPFVQELVASKRAVEYFIPDADVVIELGGEDSKILFLTGGEELRMNATCAGGTGGFIDTIAGMVGTNAAGLVRAYKDRTTTRPIASRCAVFAQNDVRSLLNEGASHGDIAASAFAAVVNQCVSGLACGRKIEGKVVFLGGPLHYLDPLVESFRETIGLDEDIGVVPKNAHLFVAMGAALDEQGTRTTVSSVLAGLSKLGTGEDDLLEYLDPLFTSEEEYEQFKEDHRKFKLPTAHMWGYNGPMYLGVDSGSTTMKSVLTDAQGRILRTYYQKNDGNVVTSARWLLKDLYQSMQMAHTAVGPDAYIAKVAVTGYGEPLLRKAFGFDYGIVETVAHMKAAQSIMPDVDFLLDIGGQDIKCIRIRDGRIDDITLNEACSSGCGSLLSGFAHTMLMSDYAFAQSGLFAEKPVDLGMRCTVFMTSRVRHAQKVGASNGDISAGLAYSVVKNALYRVMDVHDIRELGENMVVQGGTFKNDAVLRAFEKTLGRTVARADEPGLMGAYGAALHAIEHDEGGKSTILDAFKASTVKVVRESRRCDLCTNSCLLTDLSVSHSIDEAREYNPMTFVLKGVHSYGLDATDIYRVTSAQFIMGNRCTRPIAAAQPPKDGREYITRQYRRLFKIDPRTKRIDRGRIGIPRVLLMYEQFPFWQAFFGALGFEVVLSDRSSTELYRQGMSNVTSESTCYPAKLAHGHIANLVERGISRMFYPHVRNEDDAFDCPVICDYAHILEMGSKGLDARVTFASPRVGNSLFEGRMSEADARELLEALDACEVSVERAELEEACAAGVRALQSYYAEIAAYVDDARKFMEEHGGWGVSLVCRPYHLDPEINHSIPTLLETSGMTVVSSEAIWAYMRRESISAGQDAEQTGWRVSDIQQRVAQWTTQAHGFELVSLYSFGCGIDVCLHDALREVCRKNETTFTALKVDDMTDISSTRIRVRSLIAALEERDDKRNTIRNADEDIQATMASGSVREQELSPQLGPLFLPNWMPVHMPFVRHALTNCGFEVIDALSGNGVGTGISIAGSDVCQTILSSIGQLAEHCAEAGTGDNAALVVPYACSSCTARSIGRMAKSSIESFDADRRVVSMEKLVCEQGVPAEFTEMLARSIVAGDIACQICCKLLAYDPVHDFEVLASTFVDEVLSRLSAAGTDACVDTIALELAEEKLRALDCSGAEKQHIAVLGSASLALTPNLNNEVFARISEEGCEAVPSSLATQAVHNTLVEAGLVFGEQAARLNAFAECTMTAQEHAFKRMGELGVGYAPALSYLQLERVAHRQDIDMGVNAGAGWCTQASMLSLADAGYHNVLFSQTFTCLSSHVAGSGVFKEVRAYDAQANLSSVEYDIGISHVNQINRIKLLTSLAKARG